MRTVKQASMEAGISPDTLRYYDKAGLLIGVSRDSMGGRVFDDEAIRWLRCIVALRESGMSIADIKRFASLTVKDEETARQRSAMLVRCKQNLQERARKIEDSVLLVEGLLDETRSGVPKR